MQEKLGHIIRDGYERFENWRKFTNSRKQALEINQKVIESKKESILDKNLIKRIKNYAGDKFGDPGYWPWLALYTEIREEFIDGWIPDDYYRFNIIPGLNPQSISRISTLKSFDHRIFKEFSLKPMAVIVSGQIYDCEQNKITERELIYLLKNKNSELVIKWDSAATGDGVIIKHTSEVDLNDFQTGRNYVIQPYVQQHPDISRLYDKSVNTLRIVTVTDSGNKIQELFSILRFGTNGIRVDKLMAGGRFLALGKDGFPTSNAYNHLGLDTGDQHPDTHFQYKKLRVPNFDIAVEKCKRAHELFPYMKFIAWDVCIDVNGEPRLIEWNTVSPGMWRYEATLGPLWDQNSIT